VARARFVLLLALAATASPAAAGRRLAAAQPRAEPGSEPTIDAARMGPDALRRYARTQTRARHFAEAIRAYERLLGLAPADTDAMSQLARLRAWTGDYDRAIVLYRDAIARRPADLELQSDLGDVLAWAKRLEEAERQYEQVLAAEEDHHEALKGVARVRLLRGDAAGAGRALDRALVLYPSDPDLYRERARMLAQGDDFAGAARSLRAAVALAPADVDLQRHLGEVLLRAREWTAAVEAWSRVTRLDPDAASSHVGLARAYQGLGKEALAREHVQMALRMSPSDAAAREVLGQLDHERGLAPWRSAADGVELVAYALLLVLVLLVARKTRQALRRRPVARAFALWVVPAFLVLNVVAHLAKELLWRHVDVRLFESATEVVLFLGLGVAFLAVLRHQPTVQEFSEQVVLAIGAHPDDIELGCAGFLLKLKASGAKVHGLTMTRGEKGADDPAAREQEARAAAAFLELDGYAILDFPDTGLEARMGDMKRSIEARIRELGATMVLTHADVDVHGDHRAVCAATREAARAVPTVLSYEDVSTTAQFTPNLYVDVTPYLEDHLRACALHRSQQHRTYMDPKVIQGRAAHRGMQVGVSFAQAFRTLNLVR